MKRFLISVFFVCVALAPAGAQLRMRDVFASAPDSVFPLLTRNNRLDCIDFAENGMQARVKNRFENVCELKKLTDEYMLMQLSERSTVEMRVLSDSLFCMIKTYRGPAPDSEVRFFDASWHPVSVAMPNLPVESFWTSVPDSLRTEATFVQRSLSDLKLVHVTISPSEPIITCTLQTSELERKDKELAQRFVQPLMFRWDGQKFVPQL